MPLDHHMRMQRHTVAENHIGADHAEGTDPDILAQSRGLNDDGCRMDGNGHGMSTFRNRRRSALRIDDHRGKFGFGGAHIVNRGKTLELPQRPFC